MEQIIRPPSPIKISKRSDLNCFEKLPKDIFINTILCYLKIKDIYVYSRICPTLYNEIKKIGLFSAMGSEIFSINYRGNVNTLRNIKEFKESKKKYTLFDLGEYVHRQIETCRNIIEAVPRYSTQDSLYGLFIAIDKCFSLAEHCGGK